MQAEVYFRGKAAGGPHSSGGFRVREPDAARPEAVSAQIRFRPLDQTRGLAERGYELACSSASGRWSCRMTRSFELAERPGQEALG